MFSLTDALPVGAFAEHCPAWPRFIDRHDRRHLAAPLKKQSSRVYCTDNTGQWALNPQCRETLPCALDASFSTLKNPRHKAGGFSSRGVTSALTQRQLILSRHSLRQRMPAAPSYAAPSQDHQRSVVRRRRDEHGTLRLRSSRAPRGRARRMWGHIPHS
jgi:hypothetical protein